MDETERAKGNHSRTDAHRRHTRRARAGDWFADKRQAQQRSAQGGRAGVADCWRGHHDSLGDRSVEQEGLTIGDVILPLPLGEGRGEGLWENDEIDMSLIFISPKREYKNTRGGRLLRRPSP